MLNHIDSTSSSSGLKTKRIANVSIKSKSYAYALRLHLDIAKLTQKAMWEYFSDGLLYEPEVSLFLMHALKRGDCFLDIGAHIGYFSLLASMVVGTEGKVFAFEPEDKNYRQLIKNACLNGLENIESFNCALGAENGECDLFINLDNDGGHALWDVCEHPLHGKSRANKTRQKVKMKTIDSIFQNIDLGCRTIIKIDTEGSEYDTIVGGVDTIRRYKIPYIICEINRSSLKKMGSTEKKLRDFMGKIGYSTFLLHPQSLEILKLEPEGNVTGTNTFNVVFGFRSVEHD
jgi:FkbM family methyltransferase